MNGQVTSARKLRVGFFAQHQVEELNVNDTPIQHLIQELPNEHVSRLRARLAGFGLGPDQAETKVGRLSGGQKARLSLLLATLPAPHLLILDEPTNHLDIESREALVEALTAYSGAVILVSHDMHLLSMVADRLWLVHNGSVTPYDDDLEAYRQMHLKGVPGSRSQEKAEKKPKKAGPKRLTREETQALRKTVRAYEERVGKLGEIKDKIVAQLANREFYDRATAAQAETMQKKYAEVVEALEKAETQWLAHLEKLESAAAA